MVWFMWVLPTFNRPEKAQKTLDSLQQAGCQTPGLVYIDGSINPLYQHLKIPKGWEVLKTEKNRGVCSALNDVLNRYPNCPWYGFISDDSIVRTPKWDQLLLSQADDFSIVHSADGWQANRRIHGAVLFGGELIRALGWWVPRGITHCFCDDVWEMIAEACDLRRYVPDVLVEHLHFWNGKTDLDSSYIKAYETFDADKKAFLKWKETDFEDAIKRVRKKIASVKYEHKQTWNELGVYTNEFKSWEFGKEAPRF